MRFRHGCAVLFPALLAGCVSTHPTASIVDQAVMRETILKHIPPGTTLEEAQEFMVDGGFDCRLIEDDASSHQPIGGLETAGPEIRDCYLYCDRSDGVNFWVSRRWQVSIGLEDNRVTGVSASEAYVGP